MADNANKSESENNPPIANIYDFYDGLLTSAAHATDADGNILTAFTDKRDPVEIGGKPLVLPLPSKLRDPNPDEMFFHPLCEQLQRYESDVFRYLKRSMTLKLIHSFGFLGGALLSLQNDPGIQRRMSIEQIEVMKGISVSDKNSPMAWVRSVMGPVEDYKGRMDKWAIHVYIKRNGQLDGRNYKRVGVVSFPWIEKFLNGEMIMRHNAAGDEVNAFRPTKDYETFRQVALAIFPQITAKGTEYFNVGYDGTLAPYLITFLQVYYKLGSRINELLELFRPFMIETGNDPKAAILNLNWYPMLSGENLETLARFARGIPILKGNAGATVEGEVEVPEETKEVEKPRKPEPEAKAKTVSETKELTEEERRAKEEADAKRAAWKKQLAEEEEMEREREERRNRRHDRDDRDYDRDRRDRDRDRDRYDDRRDDRRRSRDDDDDLPWEDEKPKSSGDKLSVDDLFGRGSRLVRGTRTDEEEQDRRYSRGSRRDRDDRDYDRRDDRYYDRGGRRDDRDYDRRDDRYYDRGGRRDDRDYDRRDDRYYDRGGRGRR